MFFYKKHNHGGQTHVNRLSRSLTIFTLVVVVAAAGVAVFAPHAQRTLGGDPPNVTESYLLLQIHRNYAAGMANAWANAWSWCGASAQVDSSDWQNHKTIVVTPASGGSNHETTFQFSQIGYDPTASQIAYGQPTTSTVEAPLDGHNYIYDLTGIREDGKFAQTDQVELNRTRSVEITHGVTFDATTSVETKISGSYVGVGIEATAKAEFGYSNTQEEARAQAESTTHTESHEFDIPLPANTATRISLASGSTTAATPISIDGVATWVDTVTLGAPCVSNDDGFAHWWNVTGRYVVSPNNPAIFACWGLPPGVSTTPTQGPANTFGGAPASSLYTWLQQTVDNPCSFSLPLPEVEALFYGRHSAWQGMAGWLNTQPASVATALDHTLDTQARTVQIRGVQHTEAQRDIVTKVTTISPTMIPDLLAEGAVQCDPQSVTC